MKIILADDHPLFLEGLRKVLSDRPGVEILDSVDSGSKAMSRVIVLRPDLLISDLMMPDTDGLEIAERIQNDPDIQTKVLILSTYESEEYIRKSLKVGVSGFITKDAVEDEILEAIEEIRQGKEYFGKNILSKVLDILRRPGPAETVKFTKREQEVLRLLAEGMENKEIAEQLFVSVHTVANHRASMLQKMEVKNTIQLINKTRGLGMLT